MLLTYPLSLKVVFIHVLSTWGIVVVVGGVVAILCLTLATLWAVARQAPLPVEFSKQEYWSGLPFPFPGSLPYPGIEPESPALQADSLPLSHQESPMPMKYRLTNVFMLAY